MKFFLILLFLFLAQNVFSQKTDTVFLAKTEYNSIYIEPNKNSVQAQILLKIKDKNAYIPIYQFQGKYYLYAPCDWIWHKTIKIHSDSVVLQMGGEEITCKIEKKQKKKKTVFYSLQNDYLKAGLSIKTIDKKNGITIAKFSSENGISYFLVVNSSKAEKYPVIVNDCPYNKTKEMEFDEIELEKLFNQ